MKIGIDIDDTLTNTKKLQIKYWKIYYSQNKKDGYNENLPQTINEFGDDYIQKFWDTYREELSFSCQFKNNASKYIKKIKEDGFTICIITSRPNCKYKKLHQRLSNWLNENNIVFDIIYTNIREKGLFCSQNNINILIDDDIKHIKNALENNVIGILFNNNPTFKGYQTEDWGELYQIIQKLKEK